MSTPNQPEIDPADPLFGILCEACGEGFLVQAFSLFRGVRWNDRVIGTDRPFLVDLRTGMYRVPTVTAECPGCHRPVRIALGVFPSMDQAVKVGQAVAEVDEGVAQRFDPAGRVAQPEAAAPAPDMFAARRQRDPGAVDGGNAPADDRSPPEPPTR